MGYLLDNCRFGRLTSEIINQCQPYTCSKNADIDSFFHDHTLDNYRDYMLEMMGTTHCFFTDEKDNTTQPKMVCAFSLSNSSLIFGLSALFLRIVSVGYVVSSGLPESWTFIQRLYIQLYS